MILMLRINSVKIEWQRNGLISQRKESGAKPAALEGDKKPLEERRFWQEEGKREEKSLQPFNLLSSA